MTKHRDTIGYARALGLLEEGGKGEGQRRGQFFLEPTAELGSGGKSWELEVLDVSETGEVDIRELERGVPLKEKNF